MAKLCIFCDLGRQPEGGAVLHKDDRAYVVRDIDPKAPVHLLVIPMEHVSYLADEEDSREPLLGHLVLVAREMARRQGIAEQGYRLVVNQGADGGQHVPHLHVHVLGGRPLGAMG